MFRKILEVISDGFIELLMNFDVAFIAKRHEIRDLETKVWRLFDWLDVMNALAGSGSPL